MSKPLEKIPEVDLQALISIMRAFAIQAQPIEGRPYAVRFIGTPYNAFVEDCRTFQVAAHARGTTPKRFAVSPLVINALLLKFELTEADFLAELNSLQAPRIEFPTGTLTPEGDKPTIN